ncbi:MAG: hypothetical protein MUF70_00115 [Myxococcota bacterium]|jgi:hypothetical protein|nr:hypothetical protein [Myxococcota bacterium]
MSAKKSKRPSTKRKGGKPAARKKTEKSPSRRAAAQPKRAKAKAPKKRAARVEAATPGVVYSDLRRSIGEGLLGRLLNS